MKFKLYFILLKYKSSALDNVSSDHGVTLLRSLSNHFGIVLSHHDQLDILQRIRQSGVQLNSLTSFNQHN